MKESDADYFIGSVGYRVTSGINKSVELRSFVIPEGNDYVNGYYNILSKAYRESLEVVLKPDIIWYTLLCELANIVNKNSNLYRSIFTVEPKDKITIKIVTDYASDLSKYIDEIIKCLRNLVPNNLTDKFLIDFKENSESRLAQHAAFADTVKTYYGFQGNQGYQGSWIPSKEGIQYVHMEGTKKQWKTIAENWKMIGEVMCAIDPIKKDYFNRVSKILDRLTKNPDQEFLCGIYKDGAKGWFNRLEYDGYLTHMSQVPYTNGDTKENFVLVSGVFSSKLVGKVFHPNFGHIIFKVKEESDGVSALS